MNRAGEFETILTRGDALSPKSKLRRKLNMRKEIRFITTGAVIAALYAALTVLLWPISSGQIQFRLAEALCVLPAFTPAAIPGLTIGCAIANLIGGGQWIDTVFGSVATLLGAICTYLIGRSFRVGSTKRVKLGALILCPLPPVIFNAAIIPFVLYFCGLISVYVSESTSAIIAFTALTVGAGEAAVCYVLGIPLMIALNRIGRKIGLR